MPAGTVRPLASHIPPLSDAVTAEYATRGWRITEHGRVSAGTVVGPCTACHKPTVRYGPHGQPFCPQCRPGASA